MAGVGAFTTARDVPNRLHRSDRAWTVDQIRALDAQPIPWMRTNGIPCHLQEERRRGRSACLCFMNGTHHAKKRPACFRFKHSIHGEMLALDMCAAPGSGHTIG